ncbi:hypothetical protein [Pilimelia columellifera]|uniref:Fibronectin type-III domain-containing protein n=1 Tax=Pilimelia columellifera subsp. columellifera TaxID=706583 RepID=A0ABN3NCE5_9ACTN
MSRRTAYALTVAGIVVAGAATGTAYATWTVDSAATAQATTAALPVVGSPTAESAGRAVTLRWDTPRPTPDGYLVLRFAEGTDQPVQPAGSCRRLVTTPTCRDAGVPPGRWRYAVLSTRGHWVGRPGALSEPVVVGGPDAASPTISPTPTATPTATPAASPGPVAPAGSPSPSTSAGHRPEPDRPLPLPLLSIDPPTSSAPTR